MTMSRAQMSSQLKGNKMYKKSSVGSMLAEAVDGKKKDKDQKPVRTAKHGGKIGRGDGCAVRGKTKGTMR